MSLAITLCFSISTLMITYQDFKYRAVHLVFLLSLFAASILDAIQYKRPIGQMLQTFIFLLVVLVLLSTYLSLKSREIINPIKQHLGLGDLLFFLATIPMFCFNGYILFFISGLLFALLASQIFKEKLTDQGIPLAGLMAVFLIAIKILQGQGILHFSTTMPLGNV